MYLDAIASMPAFFPGPRSARTFARSQGIGAVTLQSTGLVPMPA